MFDLTLILTALERLAARERRLAATRAGLLLLGGLLLLWAAGMGAAASGLTRQSTRLLLGLPLIAGLGAGGWLLSRAWVAAGKALHQGRLVERAAPSLEGMVVNLAEQPMGPGPGQSAAIFELLISNVHQGLQDLKVDRVHPTRMGTSAGLLAACLLGFVWASMSAPMGPMQTLSWLAGGSAPAQELVIPDPEDEGSRVRVGDLTLRYEYPEYTGLSPMEVPNSNGEVHGPVGTVVHVSGRSDEPYDQVLVQAYDLPPEPSEMEGDRAFSGSFVILEAGQWRALFQRGAETLSTRSFNIVAEPDNPPVVDLQGPARTLEVALDDPFTLSWSARDDFGVVLVELTGNDRSLRILEQPLIAQRELKAELTVSARDLGLKAGTTVLIRVSAVDNNAVVLRQPGVSRSIRVRVHGDEAEERRQVAYRKELRDVLVQVLAPFVMDETPLARSSQEAGSWAKGASERFEPLNELVSERWQGEDLRTLEGRVIEEVQASGSSLLRFSMELGVQDGALDPRDMVSLGEQQEELVALLETYVLMLDRIVRYQALGLLVKDLEEMQRSGDRARRQAERQELAELKSALPALEEQLAELQELSASIDNGTITGMVGQSSRELEALLTAAEVARAHQDHARAAELLVWYVAELERLRRNLESWQKDIEEMTDGEGDELQRFIEELKRIEAAERVLLDQSRGARSERGVGDAQLVSAWEKIEGLSDGAAARALKAHSRTQRRSEMESRDLDQALNTTKRLREAVGIRDLRSARVATAAAQRALVDASTTMRFYDRDPAWVSELRRAVEDVEEIWALLESLDRSVRAASPELAQALTGYEPEQRALREDTARTQPTAAKLAAKLPGGAPGLEENLDAAVREMQDAEQALVDGYAFAAEGAQEAAADRIHLALEALMQAAASQQQMQDEMGDSGAEDGEPSGGGGESWGEDDNPEMELPEPERDVDIARYRQQLMEGMEGEVPDEYETLNRRYYEELVRQ